MKHDCRLVQESLIDLLFKELDEEKSLRLLSEVDACAECREQYRSMSLTLFAFDQATATLAPEENFWTDYHAKLERRVEAVAADRATARAPRGQEAPLWQRFLGASVRVPAPVAALALLLLAGSSLFAIMRTQQSSNSAPQAATQAAPPAAPAAAQTVAQVEEKTRIVEVPVIRERVVTRTVYVARETRAAKTDAPRREDRREDDGQTIQDVPATNARSMQETAANGAHAALAGFKPAGEVKLRIIKGTYQDEK